MKRKAPNRLPRLSTALLAAACVAWSGPSGANDIRKIIRNGVEAAGEASTGAARNVPDVNINPAIRAGSPDVSPNITGPNVTKPGIGAADAAAPGNGGQVNIRPADDYGSVSDNLRPGANFSSADNGLPANRTPGPGYGSADPVNQRPQVGEYANPQDLLDQANNPNGLNRRANDGDYGQAGNGGKVGNGEYENPEDLLRGFGDAGGSNGGRQVGNAGSDYENPQDLLRGFDNGGGADAGYQAVNAADARRMLADYQYRDPAVAARAFGDDYMKWPAPQLVPDRYAQIPPPRVSPLESKSLTRDVLDALHDYRKTIAAAGGISVLTIAGTIYGLDQSGVLDP